MEKRRRAWRGEIKRLRNKVIRLMADAFLTQHKNTIQKLCQIQNLSSEI